MDILKELKAARGGQSVHDPDTGAHLGCLYELAASEIERLRSAATLTRPSVDRNAVLEEARRAVGAVKVPQNKAFTLAHEWHMALVAADKAIRALKEPPNV